MRNVRRGAIGIWVLRAAMVSLGCMSLVGCGLAAAPCRVGAAVIKIVPVVGGVAAAPADACANVIDPTPTGS